MNFQSGCAIMGESGKCLNTIPAHVTRPDEGLPMPIRSLKYRLYPNQAQAEWLTGQLREACDLYNCALEERRGAWKRELPRYDARPNDNHVRGVEIYSHMVWDREAEEAVAYTSSELTALSYTAQMNEKGFIEP